VAVNYTAAEFDEAHGRLVEALADARDEYATALSESIAINARVDRLRKQIGTMERLARAMNVAASELPKPMPNEEEMEGVPR
jgi:hypothetical protein